MNEFIKQVWEIIVLYPLRINSKNRELILKKSIDSIPNKVLDVGCGDNFYKKYFKNSYYVGLDFPSNTVDHSKEMKHPDIWADGQRLPLKKESFDFIMCIQVMEHIPNTSEVIDEFNRILLPGGKLFLSVPHSYRIHESPYDYWRFTKYGLSYLLSNHGFEIIQIKPTTNSFFNGWNIFLTSLFQPNVKFQKTKIIILTLIMYILKLTIFNMDDQSEWEHPVNWVVVANKYTGDYSNDAN